MSYERLSTPESRDEWPSASRAYAAGASNASIRRMRALPPPTQRTVADTARLDAHLHRGSIDDGRDRAILRHLLRSPPQRAAAGEPRAAATAAAGGAHQRPRRPSDPRVRGADDRRRRRRYSRWLRGMVALPPAAAGGGGTGARREPAVTRAPDRHGRRRRAEVAACCAAARAAGARAADADATDDGPRVRGTHTRSLARVRARHAGLRQRPDPTCGVPSTCPIAGTSRRCCSYFWPVRAGARSHNRRKFTPSSSSTNTKRNSQNAPGSSFSQQSRPAGLAGGLTCGRLPGG